MFAKIFDWVSGVVGGVRGRLGFLSAILSVAVVSVLSGSAFAQDAQTAIPVQMPNIDWMSLPKTLVDVLSTPVIVGIRHQFQHLIWQRSRNPLRHWRRLR